MSKLGVFYSCHNEKKAVEYSLKELRKVYSTAPVYLVSDGGEEFKYLESEYSDIKTIMSDDTMSSTFKITDQNFRDEVHQENMKKCALAVLNRLKGAIEYCKTDYILMLDPDALVRGELNIPDNVKLLGSRVNSGLPQPFKDVLASVDGAKVINQWGATPAIFEVESFLKAYDFIIANDEIFNKLCNTFYAIYAHDVLLPTIYALIGIEESFNPDIIECNRNRNWEKTNNPLVHQFKKYY
tara:strand:+ start:2587 stop:3306 length:720 start_codon:yes stop_codon:yes gene_type:complete